MTLTQALSADHYEEVVIASAVDPEVATQRGYRTLSGTDEERAELKAYGYKPGLVENDETYPALLIPMHGMTGEERGVQIKPRVPRVRTKSDGTPSPIKYESAPGAPLVVDVPAFTREALQTEGTALWITEGMKKTDSLVSQGLAAVGLTGVFNWRNKMGTLGDWEDVPIKGRPAVVCFDADAHGNRNVQLAMARLGAWLKSRGATAVNYLVVPAEVEGTPVKGVDDFFAAGGDVATLAAAATQVPPGGGAADASFADAYLVEEVVSGSLEGRFCWSSGLGWMKWDGRVWVEVADTEPVEAVRLWALAQFEGVLSEQKRDMSKQLQPQIQGWRAVLTKARLRSLVDLARGIIERYADDFDADPDLLTVKNGTIHLPSGRLMDFDPGHSITKMAKAVYKPGAKHPVWEKALEALPPENRPWLQDRLGQAITGHKTPDHVLVLSHGTGGNGKSTVVNCVRKALGDYAVVISDRVLMANPDAHPTELMDLRGARYAVLEETPEAGHLNVQRLKVSVGTDSIKARRIRQDPVEFIASHSLFINTNYKPQVVETDHGTWRRLAMLTYPYTFRKRPSEVVGPMDRLGDPTLEYAHQDPAVLTACLAWMVEGAVAWYGRDRRMLDFPEAVEQSTREWRAETDLVIGFSDDCLTFDPEAFTRGPDLLAAFNEWSGDRGHRPWNEKTFSSRFGGHDAVKASRVHAGRKTVDGRQQRGWFGVEIRKPGGGDPFESGGVMPPAPGAQQPKEPLPDVPKEMPGTLELRAPTVVGFDIETASADELYRGRHEGPFVRLVGAVFSEDEDSFPDTSTEPDRLVADLNRADVIYGHRLFEFDLQALAHHHGADYDALAAKTIDTFTLAQLVWPSGAKGDREKYDLDSVAKRLGHTGKSDDLKALADKHGGYDKIPVDDPEYRAYLEGDLDATKYAYENLRMLHAPGESSASERTIAYAEREMRVAAIQNRMTLNGWRVDTELLAERVDVEEERRREAAQALHTEFGMPLKRPDRYKLKLKADMPPGYKDVRFAELRKWISTAEGGAGAVAVGVAERIEGEPYDAPWNTDAGKAAIIKALAAAGAEHYPRTKTGEIKTSSEALGEGTWYDQETGKSKPGLLRVYPRSKYLRVGRIVDLLSAATGATAKYAEIQEWLSPDGRVHARTGHVQASGRWATVKPASANLGKRGLKVEQRRVFLADEGHVLLTCDLSQVDVRAVAGHSQDPVLIEMLQPGKDYHEEMALIFFGDRAKRKQGKPISHGRNYGQGARAISERNSLDYEMVRAACEQHDETMPRLLEWKEEVRILGESGQLLDNGFGRLMKCDPSRAYTQAPALMGQGAARDILCESLLRLVQMRPEVTPYLRGVVHDEVILSVPEDEAPQWRDWLEYAFTWEWRGVPILCDISAPALNWADACGD